jgi:glycosyltransferase involved in cell wall biosynthesis
VISTPRIVRGFDQKPVDGVRYAILTDHVNILSKRAPEFGVEFAERYTSDSWQDVERATLNQQDHIFVLGTHVKHSMIEDYDVDARRVTVIHAGPNLDVDSERDGIVKDFSQKNILFVGLEADRKGLPTLTRAFEKVAQRFPDAHLDVAGISGTSSEKITYHGVVKGIALKKLFYNAQIFALPSLREPFGIVFLEAMWSKAVCIGSTQGAMPELIENRKTGYVVEPNDVDALADTLIESLSDPAALEAMAEAGYLAAKANYTWQRSMRVLLDALFEETEEPSVATQDLYAPQRAMARTM